MSTLLKVKVEVNAPPDRIWSVLADVERWPTWTKSVSHVERLESGVFGLGSRVRMHQPRLPPAVWQVTQWEPGRGFVWESKALGARTIGEHWIMFGHDGPSSAESDLPQTGVVLTTRQSGLLFFFLSPLLEGLTLRYVQMEAHGLKHQSESLAV